MWTRRFSCKTALAAGLALALQFALIPQARADAKFIPKDAKFKSKDKLDFGKLLFKDTKFKNFKAVDFDRKTSTETYKVKFDGKIKKKGKDFKPIQLRGEKKKKFKKNSKTGGYDTEIVSMNLKGRKPKQKIKLGLNPDMKSTGEAFFAGRRGPILSDSFFDVFFELTVGNDAPIPERGGAVSYALANVPEPASLGLLLAGLFGLSAYRRQQRRLDREQG